MNLLFTLPKNGSLRSFLSILIIILLCLLIISIVILCSVPPISRDALTHHLAIPKMYLMHKEFKKITTNMFSFYPMNLEILYIIPMYFGNDIIPKFIHFSFALMTAALIFGYLKKRINVFYGLLGALFFLSIPIIVKLSIIVYVDLGLVFFSTGSLIYLLKWVENRFQIKFIIISAVWCGLALGTKYNGLIVLFLLSLFVPFIYSRSMGRGVLNSFRALKYSTVFILIALLVFLPWMIRNYVWTKNPIYPLYQSWFQHNMKAFGSTNKTQIKSSKSLKKIIKEKQSSNDIEQLFYRRFVYNESMWEIALIPLRIFFEGKDDNPKYFDGKLNPFLCILPLFAFWGDRRGSLVLRREKWIFLFFAVLFLAITLFKIDMRIRYIAPIIPPLVILSVLGLNQIKTVCSGQRLLKVENISNPLVAAIIIFYLSMNSIYVVQQFRYVKPLTYLSGQKNREAYIESYRGEFPVFQYANKNLPDSAKIMLFFLGNRIYYSDRETLSGINLFYNTVTKSDTSDKIWLSLKKRGITHMIIRYDLFEKWVNDNFDNKGKRIIEEYFNNYSSLLLLKNGYGLFELKVM